VNALALELGAGRGLFYGLLLALAGLGARPALRRPWQRSIASVAAIVGIALVAMSATPMPLFLYSLWGTAALAALVFQESRRTARLAWPTYGVLAALSITVAALELPHQFAPSVPPIGRRRVFVIGDSISVPWEAGTGAWPDVLRERHGLDIANLADAGAETGWALHRTRLIPPGPAFVLVEIGGNDLLGHGDAARFERDLDALLAALAGSERTVVMLELPLPPFAQAFGSAQRRLAARHGAFLIPKRFFASVFRGSGRTTDGLHLTPRGQEAMAGMIAGAIGLR
jgi:acyl-CoA thioesterase-1